MLKKYPGYLPYMAAFIISLLYFLFHFHYMQRFTDTDQFVYLGNVMNTYKPGKLPVYNPHHLHFEIGGRLFNDFIIKNFGDDGYTDIAFNLRLRSLLAACTGLFFVILFLRDLTNKLYWGVIGGLLLAFGHGYLQYATKIDTGIFPAAAFIAILWVFNRIITAKRKVVFFIIPGGLFCFLGVMMHQYVAFSCAVICLTMLLPGSLFDNPGLYSPFRLRKKTRTAQFDKTHTRRFLSVTLLALTAFVFIISAYFYAGKTQYNLPFDKPDPNEGRGIWEDLIFQHWLFTYARVDHWGQGIKKFNPKRPFRGYTDAVISQEKERPKYNFRSTFRYNIDSPGDQNAFVHNQAAYFAFFTLGAVILLFPFLLARYRRNAVALAACTIVYFVFFTYWEPHYYEFWIIPAGLIVILGILILNLIGEKLTSFFKIKLQLPGILYALFLLFLFSGHNLVNYVIPYAEKQYYQGVSKKWDPIRFRITSQPDVYK